MPWSPRPATASRPCDRAWAEACAAGSASAGADAGKRSTTGADGKVDPRAIFDAIARGRRADYIAIADGGDLLSFARVGLAASTYMDAGAFGCLGVGVPFAIAAALAYPGRQVISVTGDGAFGINAMEIDTAVRHGAKAVFIVSNNAAWNIERSTRRSTTAAGSSAPRCAIPTMRRWRARSARMASGSKSRRTSPGAASGRSRTPRLWSMW